MKATVKFLIPALLLAFLLVAIASPVQAAGPNVPPNEGKIVFGGNYTLDSGQTLDGDLAVLGGNAEIEKGATVQGDVFLAGGNLIVDGEVRGEVVIVGGNLALGSSSVVTGNVNTIGGVISQTPGAQIQGEVITNERPLDLALPHSLLTPRYNFNLDPIGKVFGWFFQALALAALAMIVVLLGANATNRGAVASVSHPVTAGGIGLLTAVLAPFVLLLMIITIIGIPVAVLAILALIVAVTFGWIALGLELGKRMARMLNVSWSLPLSAGLGTFTLSLVANGIGFIPCVGWLAPFLVSMVGLGAVILTRFGTTTYPSNQYIPPVSPYSPAGRRTEPIVTVPPVEPQAPVPPEQPAGTD